MRRSAVAACCWVAATACVQASALQASTAAAPDASLELVLSRHREAVGGEAAWAAWRSVRLTGTMSSDGGRTGTPFVLTFVHGAPGKLRFEFTVQGLPGVVVFDGGSGWSRGPFGDAPARALSEGELEAWRWRADFAGPLVASAEKGIHLELLETGTGGGLRIRASRGAGASAMASQVLTLDAETYLLTRLETTVEVQGTPVEVESRFSDYRPAGGLIFARTIETGPRGAPAAQRLSIETAELDVAVAPGLFSRP